MSDNALFEDDVQELKTKNTVKKELYAEPVYTIRLTETDVKNLLGHKYNNLVREHIKNQISVSDHQMIKYMVEEIENLKKLLNVPFFMRWFM